MFHSLLREADRSIFPFIVKKDSFGNYKRHFALTLNIKKIFFCIYWVRKIEWILLMMMFLLFTLFSIVQPFFCFLFIQWTHFVYNFWYFVFKTRIIWKNIVFFWRNKLSFCLSFKGQTSKYRDDLVAILVCLNKPLQSDYF